MENRTPLPVDVYLEGLSDVGWQTLASAGTEQQLHAALEDFGPRFEMLRLRSTIVGVLPAGFLGLPDPAPYATSGAR